LEAANKSSIGLRPNFHADELFPLGGAEMAAEIKVRFYKKIFYLRKVKIGQGSYRLESFHFLFFVSAA